MQPVLKSLEVGDHDVVIKGGEVIIDGRKTVLTVENKVLIVKTGPGTLTIEP